MPSTPLRQNVLKNARRIVVKMGTQLLTRPDADEPGIDIGFITCITDQIGRLRESGYEITLVSSGAIGAGCVDLNLKKRPTDITDLQAVAAVGQRCLMRHMHEGLIRYGLHVGQMLLTRDDFDDRGRFLNIRNCISRLHELGCIPIINENDTVAVDEIRFGDNDLLAALTCNALRADALILLTVVDGLLDETGQIIDRVDNMNDCLSMVKQNMSNWSRGGMQTKLDAAGLVTEAGEIAVIASGRTENVLKRILAGEKLGTVFVPANRKLDARKRWIGLTARPAGTITIDDGAVNAIQSRGKSLLARGIQAITGRFKSGEVVLLRNRQGRELARGLTNYSDEELDLIKGKRSDQFESILGRAAYAEVVHRNNMVVLK